MAPVGLLTAQLGALAKLKVEIAWGANLLFDASNWTWTDITADVRQADGNRIRINPIGRGDETSLTQPAGCTFQLDNTSGAYSKGPQSSNYPNVRRSTPVRVSVTLNNGGTWFTRFFGYANGFKPSWDTSCNLAVVTVSASGLLRRLQQGKTPLRSPLFRAYSNSSVQPLAYYPLEDGANATQVASGLAGGSPALFIMGGFEFAQVSTCPGSAPLPQMAESPAFGQANGPIAAGPDTFWSIDFTAQVANAAIPAATTCAVAIAYPSAGGTWIDVNLVLNNNFGSLQFFGTRANLSQDMFAEYDPGSLFDGLWHHYRVTATQSGGNVNFTIECDGVQVVTNTITTATLKRLTSITMLAQNTVPYSYGHVAVFGQATSSFYSASRGYTGEIATTRMQRLMTEEGGNGMPLVVIGTCTTAMGPQSIDTFLNLLRECEAADQGLLLDGLSQALTYVTRAGRYNQAAALTLDMAQGQVDDPFEPEDDDQRNRNLYKVTRKNGSSATFEDVNGPLGTAAIGTYDSTPGSDLNLSSDAPLLNYAAWLVHVGTVDEPYRYPTLPIDLAASPSLAAAWLATTPNERIDVINVSSKATQHPPGSVLLMLEGYSEELSPFDWEIKANCSPYQPWRVAALGSWGLEMAGQTLNSDLSPGATTLSLATASGYNLFTLSSRFPADFPVDLKVAGWTIHCTAATGTSSPQTLTIDSAPNTSLIPAGTPVTLLRPVCLAL